MANRVAGGRRAVLAPISVSETVRQELRVELTGHQVKEALIALITERSTLQLPSWAYAAEQVSLDVDTSYDENDNCDVLVVTLSNHT